MEKRGMGNFDFVAEALPGVHPECARAESYALSDPRTALFYSRRAIEELVRHLCDVYALPLPYSDDLAALTNDAGFQHLAGRPIVHKLNAIRRTANGAVHDNHGIRPDMALRVLAELYHVLVWAVRHHSPQPDAAPIGTRFDPQLAKKAAPLTRREVEALAQKFAAQDAAYAKKLAEHEELAAAKDAEIAQLREQIQAAQAAVATTDNHDYDEAHTRDLFIDVLLAEAGWTTAADGQAVAQVTHEYPVTGMPNQTGSGFVDYVLWGSDGLPLAIVEAKRTMKSPQVGQQQAKLYADALEAKFHRRPVIFFTNGYVHHLWDDAGGYPPREVQGFFTADELELLIQRRSTRQPLANAPVNADIAGRHYQTRAIRAIGAAFEGKQRAALLVMATGSGKTRTVVALVEQLMKANWVKRVLFLADRTALVNQAVNVFKAQLPSVSTVNLVTEKSADGRVFVSTYPTMMNLINQVENEERRFGPGYFDLIIIDEAHRSVYQKYRSIFEWFDGLLVGLTATPKDEVDHNTYRLCDLEDGVPTDAYSLEEAVADGYLVPPKGVSVGTTFLRQGIKYADLTAEEKDQWDTLDWGEDGPPTEVDTEEINRFLFNIDTVDKVLATLMADGYKVAGGDRLGKTVIFAKNQQHAEFIEQCFNAQYPEYAGEFARLITNKVAYAQSLIDDFSTTDKAPHIAVSVDMLDTGIDVPDIVNLVFFKMVRSKSKFWQMIGRGTRLRPDLFGPGENKQDFLVFDFCGNLDYFSQDLPGSEGSNQKSLTQRLFEGRLALITSHATGLDVDLRQTTTDWLHGIIAGMNLDNYLVRPHRQHVETWSDRARWSAITPDDATDILTLSGLPSGVRDPDVEAKRFDLLILRRQLAQLENDAVTAERVRETIQAIASGLLSKHAIPSVAERLELIEQVAGHEWWVDVTLPMLELIRLRLRSLIRLLERTPQSPVFVDFADTLLDPREIALPGTTPGLNPHRFRAKVLAHLRQHDDHVALQRLRRNRQLTADDLAALEQMLVEAGAPDEEIARANGQGLGLFIRSLVGLDREAALEAFAAYLDEARFNIDQIRFITLIIDELTTNGVVEPARLFESPYIDNAPSGPEYLFPDADVDVIVDILRTVKATAVPTGAA
ncbi:MAG: DEAD/DEAH box helicase family protein [Propionibacteriaceae bacterium]|nr:DEAD/DEAH box helicase family protein [Propionibacteriaceae bacterium]